MLDLCVHICVVYREELKPKRKQTYQKRLQALVVVHQGTESTPAKNYSSRLLPGRAYRADSSAAGHATPALSLGPVSLLQYASLGRSFLCTYSPSLLSLLPAKVALGLFPPA